MTVRILCGRELIAYCAGVVDSDGTIGIKRRTYAMRVVGDSTQPTYCARICVRQVTREAVDLLAEQFGGKISVTKPSVPRGRPLFSWEVRDQIAERALRAMLPALRIKRKQAENCLELRKLVVESKVARVAQGRGHIGAARRPVLIGEKMHACYELAHALNRTGVA